MSIPGKIKIERIEEYHTHYLGSYEGGKQFWGYGTFVFDKPFHECEKDQWQHHRLEYIVLHTFDNSGRFLATKHLFAGTTAERSGEDDEEILDKWMLELPDAEFGDIEVELFEVDIDGYQFGLIPDDETESVSLEPSSTISFMEPWDGGYDT